MVWQPEVGSGTARATTKRDFLTKLVALATSQHVATVAINAAGTGYAQDDILTLTHASAHLDARFEVTSVGGSGQITGLRIVASGAFAQQAASATVSAGGSGYAQDDVLEVQGGSSRQPAKFKVDTVSGTAVATVSVFEGGGVYSSTPSNPAATLGVGPSGFAGDDAATLTVTYQAIIGTTGLSVTGGTGSGATVDITLAETGWSVDGRNANNFSHNGVTDEKQVTLVGDAGGDTNKPYVHLITGTEDVGVDVRHFVSVLGSVAHNASLTIDNQPGISPGFSGGAFSDSGAFLPFPQNEATDADFWMSVDDRRLFALINENPTATTDDGRYMSMYAGYHDRLKTESEDPYPLLIFGSTRDRDADPTTSNANITSIAECRAGGTGPCFYYRAEGAAWTQIKNNDTGTVGAEPDVMFPFGEIPLQSDGGNPQKVVIDGPMQLNDNVIKRDRTASSRRLFPVPGTSDEWFLFDLVIVRKVSNNFSEATDSTRGAVRGVFWVYNTDAAGAAINDFSEDYFTIGSDRYRVFHNHVHTARYQYIAVKEDV